MAICQSWRLQGGRTLEILREGYSKTTETRLTGPNPEAAHEALN